MINTSLPDLARMLDKMLNCNHDLINVKLVNLRSLVSIRLTGQAERVILLRKCVDWEMVLATLFGSNVVLS